MKERERERREKTEKRTKTKGYKHSRREEGDGLASLRVKPDLHDVDFYLSVHSRRCTGDREETILPRDRI